MAMTMWFKWWICEDPRPGYSALDRMDGLGAPRPTSGIASPPRMTDTTNGPKAATPASTSALYSGPGAA